MHLLTSEELIREVYLWFVYLTSAWIDRQLFG